MDDKINAQRDESADPWLPSESQRRLLELAQTFMERGTVNPTHTPFLDRFKAD